MSADPGLLHPAVRAQLAALGAAFEVMECDPALADTAAFVEAYGVPLDQSANTIVVASKGAEPIFAVCVLLATTSLDVNRVVRREMGVRKASFAGADPVRALTGMEIGGVTPFGLPEDLPILVDARVMEPAMDRARRRQSELEAEAGAGCPSQPAVGSCDRGSGLRALKQDGTSAPSGSERGAC